jgi:hypothetical protein
LLIDIRAAGKIPGPLMIMPWIQREKEMKKKNPNYEVLLISE